MALSLIAAVVSARFNVSFALGKLAGFKIPAPVPMTLVSVDGRLRCR